MTGSRSRRAPAVAPGSHGRVLTLLAVLAVAGVAGGVLAGRLPGAPPAPPVTAVAALAAYLAVAGALYVRVQHRGQSNLFDLFEVALAPAVVVMPGPVLVVVVAAAKVTSEGLRRRSPVKAAFNVAQWTAAAAAGSLVFTALRTPGQDMSPQDLPALLVAVLAVVVMNTAAVRTVLRLAAGRRRRRWPPPSLGLGAWACHRALTVGVGLLFVVTWQWAPAASPAFFVGLVALHLAAHAAAAGRIGQARVLGLQRAHRVLLGTSDLHDGAGAFLAELRRAFDCAVGELHLVEDGVVTSFRVDTTTPGGGPVGRCPRDDVPDCVDVLMHQRAPTRLAPPYADPSVARALAQLGAHDGLLAPVTVGDEPSGVLALLDRAGAQGFETGEVAVLEAAAGALGEALTTNRLGRELAHERDALRVSEARWRALVAHVSDLVVVTDATLLVRYASPAARTMLGVAESELLGRPFLDVVDPADAPEVAACLRDVMDAHAEPARAEFRLTGDRTHPGVEAVVHDLRDDPAVGGMVLSLRDVSERHRTDAFHAGAAQVLELTARGRPLEEVLGALAVVVEGQVPDSWCAVVPGRPDGGSSLVAPSAPPAVRSVVRTLVEEVTTSTRWRSDPGPTVVVDTGSDECCPRAGPVARLAGVSALWLVPVGTSHGPLTDGALAVARRSPGAPSPQQTSRLQAAAGLADTAVQHVRTQDRMAHQAVHDPLTDLPNRALFVDRLQHAMGRAARQVTVTLVVFLDIDDFKAVNDSLGHHVGDELLQAVARRLQGAVRPGDTVARFGGDEFTILCENVRDEAHAVDVSDRLRRALARPFRVARHDLFVTASIGIALTRDAGEDPESVIEHADAAMYRAKDRGGKSVEVYDEGMRERSSRRLATRSALHLAVEREEFRLVYQPTVTLDAGQVVGVEALARWQHPQEGVLSPDRFIPLAEQSGLIVPIGAQILDLACHQAHAWSQAAVAGRSLITSINLSARQLSDPGLVPTVARTIESTGVDPTTINLEITESAVMDDVDANRATLARLKNLGVRLLVDDFGTGYSSLRYLQRLPVDGLKVDRSFVAGVGGAPEDEVIVTAVIALAHSLGLLVVAEGVETPEQASRLRELGCELAQGYHFGRPMPPELLTELVLDVRGSTTPA